MPPILFSNGELVVVNGPQVETIRGRWKGKGVPRLDQTESSRAPRLLAHYRLKKRYIFNEEASTSCHIR